MRALLRQALNARPLHVATVAIGNAPQSCRDRSSDVVGRGSPRTSHFAFKPFSVQRAETQNAGAKRGAARSTALQTSKPSILESPNAGTEPATATRGAIAARRLAWCSAVTLVAIVGFSIWARARGSTVQAGESYRTRQDLRAARSAGALALAQQAAENGELRALERLRQTERLGRIPLGTSIRILERPIFSPYVRVRIEDGPHAGVEAFVDGAHAAFGDAEPRSIVFVESVTAR